MSFTPKTIVFEGNIGSGKTTCLNYIKERNKRCTVLYEPTDLWGSEYSNESLLELFYSDQKKYAYMFQEYVLNTMYFNHLLPTPPNKPRIKVMERSIFSAMHCFCETLFAEKKLTMVEYNNLKNKFKVMEQKSFLNIDFVIYLRTTPEKVINNIKKRNRKGEENIDVDYLYKIHDAHEKWLSPELFGTDENTTKLIVLNADNQDEVNQFLNETLLPKLAQF